MLCVGMAPLYLWKIKNIFKSWHDSLGMPYSHSHTCCFRLSLFELSLSQSAWTSLNSIAKPRQFLKSTYTFLVIYSSNLGMIDWFSVLPGVLFIQPYSLMASTKKGKSEASTLLLMKLKIKSSKSHVWFWDPVWNSLGCKIEWLCLPLKCSAGNLTILLSQPIFQSLSGKGKLKWIIYSVIKICPSN